MTDVRWRVCIHEAGHAVAEVVLGGTLDYVSIRPGRRFAGINVPTPKELAERDGFDPFRPVSAQPPAFRADVERRILVALAGEIAEMYAGPLMTGYRDEPEAEDIARKALKDLGPRIAELVIANEQSDKPYDVDEVKAHGLATAFAGPDAGVYYLEWLRAEARELVLRHKAAVQRVGEGLDRHAVLGGGQVAALVYPAELEGGGGLRARPEITAARGHPARIVYESGDFGVGGEGD